MKTVKLKLSQIIGAAISPITKFENYICVEQEPDSSLGRGDYFAIPDQEVTVEFDDDASVEVTSTIRADIRSLSNAIADLEQAQEASAAADPDADILIVIRSPEGSFFTFKGEVALRGHRAAEAWIFGHPSNQMLESVQAMGCRGGVVTHKILPGKTAQQTVVMDAYTRVMECIGKFVKLGISVTLTPAKCRFNPETVETYNEPGRLPPALWFNIKFKPTGPDQSKAITDAQVELINRGIAFDTGAGCGSIDWEIDWSFHCMEVSDENS